MPGYRRARTSPLPVAISIPRHRATVGQLLAVPDDDTEAQPIELTRDDVHQADVDIEVRRWQDWHSTLRSGTDGFYSELSLTEVRRRFANAGLHFSTDES